MNGYLHLMDANVWSFHVYCDDEIAALLAAAPVHPHTFEAPTETL